jgi:serine phosphatase RsbU (regulator of sigma subunit)
LREQDRIFDNKQTSKKTESVFPQEDRKIDKHLVELTTANYILKKQNESINKAQETINSSLRYGRIIQNTVNAGHKEVSAMFPNSFTFYSPQNFIGGDLIWTQRCKFGKIIAVVDCMGHGVPGAMLAMSVYHFLNSTLLANKFESVTDFLCNVSDAYYSSFFDTNKGADFADTFDISLCVIDEKSEIIRFRGIKRPLIIVRDEKITEFKGERVSVAEKETSQVIKTKPWDRVWPYKKGDNIYLFTDGFQDQFGGDKNKKYKYSNFKKHLQVISKQPSSIQGELINSELLNWRNTNDGFYEQTDDIAVVGIKL